VSAAPVIRFAGVHKVFGDLQVLRGVSFCVLPGSVHFIMGPSGVGKSVTIKQLVGLLRPDAGVVELFGEDVSALDERAWLDRRRRCQMIFQQATLFDALTVLENVAMPVAKRFRLSRGEAEVRARRALAQVDAEALSDRLPPTLGGGVRKRIAIARALALEPEVLLYDEPTTGLDPVAARRTDRLIRHTSRALGLTSVVVSHDLESVAAIGDWVVLLHEGQVVFDGRPDAMFAATDPLIRGFVHGAGQRFRAEPEATRPRLG
jgi:phospholipid/cholesterol/gamma-HCH transport system ATP-binding protein